MLADVLVKFVTAFAVYAFCVFVLYVNIVFKRRQPIRFASINIQQVMCTAVKNIVANNKIRCGVIMRPRFDLGNGCYVGTMFLTAVHITC